MRRGSDAEIWWSLRWGLAGLALGVSAVAAVCVVVIVADIPLMWALGILVVACIVGVPLTRQLGHFGHSLDDDREARDAVREDDPDEWLRDA